MAGYSANASDARLHLKAQNVLSLKITCLATVLFLFYSFAGTTGRV
jgi:hypothetical protein